MGSLEYPSFYVTSCLLYGGWGSCEQNICSNDDDDNDDGMMHPMKMSCCGVRFFLTLKQIHIGTYIG